MEYAHSVRDNPVGVVFLKRPLLQCYPVPLLGLTLLSESGLTDGVFEHRSWEAVTG